ncbi:unnamed protein product, partial [Didymodactylos carnosus]
MVDTTTKLKTVLSDEDLRKQQEHDAECFVCRNSHIYVKPIGVQNKSDSETKHRCSTSQKPLSDEEISELSKKKKLSRQDVKKLLQSYFPEIKGAKYFQLHKYHSCCYDPDHINNSKNHITALQYEKHEEHNHRHHYPDRNNNGPVEDGTNKVSFVRIKIEPTNGIPTRFLGPTALPEPLADMLIKQVNRLENKKNNKSEKQSLIPNSAPSYNVRRLKSPLYEHTTSLLSDKSNNTKTDDEDDENSDTAESTHEEEEKERSDPEMSTIQINSAGEFEGKVMDGSHLNFEHYLQETAIQVQNQTQPKARERSNEIKSKVTKPDHHTKREQKENKPSTAKTTKNKDLTVEDLDQVKPSYTGHNYQEEKPKKNKKKQRKRLTVNAHEHNTLRHWEVKALEQAYEEPCELHHVKKCSSCEANHLLYKWCRCKEHQHELFEDQQRKRRRSMVTTFRSTEPTSASQPQAPPIVKMPPPVIKKSILKSTGSNAMKPRATKLALSYDPAAADYDMIQEAIYYRTSSGRLIKPEVSNAFAYDTIPQSTTRQNTANYQQPVNNIYMMPNGEIQQLNRRKAPQQHVQLGRNMNDSSGTLILSNGGSMYRGQIADMNNHSMPLITLPYQTTPMPPYYYNQPNLMNPIANGYYLPQPVIATTQWSPVSNLPVHHQPAEFTLATINDPRSLPAQVNDASSPILNPGSQILTNSTVPRVSERTPVTLPKSLNKTAKKSKAPKNTVKGTNNDLKKTANNKNYIVKNTHNKSSLERQSSIFTHRRWFDQALGDQNLEPVQESKYGLIVAGSDQEWIPTGQKTVTFQGDNDLQTHYRKTNNMHYSQQIEE